MRPFDRGIEFIPAFLFHRPAGPSPDAAKRARDLARLLEWGGWPSPVVVDDDGRVVAGAERIDAAMLLGEQCNVPVARARALSAADRACFRAADGRLGAKIKGGAHVLGLGEDGTGPGAADATRPTTPAPALTRAGEVWRLGRHRLACADARKAMEVSRALDHEQADLVLLDPPQNLFGQTRREPYVKAIVGLMSAATIALRDGGLMLVSLDWRNLHTWLMITGNIGLAHCDTCVWVGAEGVAGALYPCGCKLVLAFRKGGPHINNLALDAKRANAWIVAPDPDHPSALPPDLIAAILEDATPGGGRVLHACAGSGFALEAAERTRREAVVVEISPARCDAMLARFTRSFGGEPVQEASGETLSERAAQAARHTPAG